MVFLCSLFIFVIGVCFGSFLNVLVYRYPLGMSLGGRSFCPKCKSKIVWYDNIPLVSYVFLSGKCRKCAKRISSIYPLLELFVGLVFVVFFNLFFVYQTYLFNTPLGTWQAFLGDFSLFYFLFVALLLTAIFIIDLKNMIIPDSLSLLGYLSVLVLLVLVNPDNIWMHVYSGFLFAGFLLFLNLITRGKGMGLGDVKLALFLATLLGITSGLIWMFLAFIIGALYSIVVLVFGKAKLKSQVAFGPFLIIAFVITLFIEKGYFLKYVTFTF